MDGLLLVHWVMGFVAFLTVMIGHGEEGQSLRAGLLDHKSLAIRILQECEALRVLDMVIG